MPITKPQEEIDFLDRVDSAYRNGLTQEQIAGDEGISGSGSLIGKVARLGFRFERKGGLKLVDILMARPFAEWISSGDLAAESTEAVA